MSTKQNKVLSSLLAELTTRGGKCVGPGGCGSYCDNNHPGVNFCGSGACSFCDTHSETCRKPCGSKCNSVCTYFL
jgi:hypothetical protein